MSDARTGQSFCNDADHDAQHRHAAIEKLHAFQLGHMDFTSGGVLKPLVVSGGGWHETFVYERILQPSLRNVKGCGVGSRLALRPSSVQRAFRLGLVCPRCEGLQASYAINVLPIISNGPKHSALVISFRIAIGLLSTITVAFASLSFKVTVPP